PLLALRVAKAVAALAGRARVDAPDAEAAARLCLAPRALAAVADTGGAPPEPQRATSGALQGERGGEAETGAGAEVSTIVAATRAVLPEGWIEPSPQPGRAIASPGRSRGRGGAPSSRGRTVATRPGRPDDRHPLDLPATLRAAIPWQARRGRGPDGPLALRPDDLQVAIRRAPPHAIMVVAVDASGSAALGRLAEAKGAVELLLARSYVRRDSVALVSFGGQGAALLLPPTRSLARAKRELAELPGGGGTPLAAGLDLAAATALGARRGGSEVSIAVLTDGRANLSRSGTGGRAAAEADGLDAATRIRAARLAAVVIDVAPRPGPAARRLAEAMGARYLVLPRADASGIADALMPAPGAAL
ncbi:MAG: VWA domain-containing protein, partial [Caulobacteraceae bacterium]|nr:VWA domain-containing protein [Caulobacter sp.]